MGHAGGHRWCGLVLVGLPTPLLACSEPLTEVSASTGSTDEPTGADADAMTPATTMPGLPDASAGTTGGPTGTGSLDTGSGSLTAGSTTADDGQSSGEDLPTLVDRGLLARYFIDETDQGQDPLFLIDSTPDPLPLGLVYAPDPMQPTFVEQGGHRGLEWQDHTALGAAQALVSNTKIEAALEGSSTLTLEVVIDPQAFGDLGFTSRIIHIGAGFNGGRVTLGATSAQGFRLRINDATRTEWLVDVGTLDRVVLQLVVDLGEPRMNDRARLFIDGVLQAPTGGSGLMPNDTVNFLGGEWLMLGNRQAFDRSFGGVLYYAAIYEVALDGDELASNRARLTVDDDGLRPTSR